MHQTRIRETLKCTIRPQRRDSKNSAWRSTKRHPLGGVSVIPGSSPIRFSTSTSSLQELPDLGNNPGARGLPFPPLACSLMAADGSVAG